MAILKSGNTGPETLRRTWKNAGSPTDGTSGTLATIAEPGDLLVDSTNGVLYLNSNTKESPTWSQLATT